MIRPIVVLLSVGAIVSGLSTEPASSQTRGFGGPDAVENLIRSDRQQVDALFELEYLDPWFAFKEELVEDTGLSFGIDYSSIGYKATDSPGDDAAASGMFRVFGAWELIGRGTHDTGALVFKGENRHSYTDVAPSGYGFDIGYVGLLNAPFSDEGFRLTNLYWRQRLFGGRSTVTVGFLDATDYVDAFALGSPWLHFSNLVFSTGSGAIGLPNDATLGVAGGAFLTENVYTIAGLADANADPTEPFKGFNSFFDESDYFSSIEMGWTSAPDRLIFDNVHVTLWNTDGSERFGVNDGWGVAGSATWYVEDQWLPFVRGGYSEDGGALLEASVSAGLGWQPEPGPGRDVLGIGLNWGRPNSDSFGSGLKNQWTGELFYRFNLGKRFAITPDAQVLIDPALNPDENIVGVFGLRGRLVL